VREVAGSNPVVPTIFFRRRNTNHSLAGGKTGHFFGGPEQLDFSSGNADRTPHSLPLKTRVLWLS
jgi:hypothetical protein